jgi:hypothetical protein
VIRAAVQAPRPAGPDRRAPRPPHRRSGLRPRRQRHGRHLRRRQACRPARHDPAPPRKPVSSGLLPVATTASTEEKASTYAAFFG